jgi:hypothetical protein
MGKGILKGEVSQHRWPPVWLVWNQLFDNGQFLFLCAVQTNPNQSNRRSKVQWYFPLLCSCMGITALHNIKRFVLSAPLSWIPLMMHKVGQKPKLKKTFYSAKDKSNQTRKKDGSIKFFFGSISKKRFLPVLIWARECFDGIEYSWVASRQVEWRTSQVK